MYDLFYCICFDQTQYCQNTKSISFLMILVNIQHRLKLHLLIILIGYIYYSSTGVSFIQSNQKTMQSSNLTSKHAQNKSKLQNLPKSKSMVALFNPLSNDQSKIKQICKASVAVSQLTKESKGLKLRDYLFQMQLNSKKVKQLKPNTVKQVSTNLMSSSSEKLLKSSSKVLLRKEKYQIDNDHIFGVVSKELKQDLTSIVDITHSINHRFQQTIDGENLSQKEMLEIYSIRRIIKEKILKQLIEIDNFLKEKESNGSRQRQINQKHQRQLNNRVAMSMSIIQQKDELQNSHGIINRDFQSPQKQASSPQSFPTFKKII